MITVVETLIELRMVPEYLAGRPTWWPSRALKPSRMTVNRWHMHGVNGHKLETIKVNNRLLTSIEALDRFFARCAGTPATPTVPTSRGMSKAEAKEAIRPRKPIA